MMKNMFRLSFSLFLLILGSMATAQNKIVLVNGGQYGNPAEMPNVVLIDEAGGETTIIDTLGASSVQDVIIEENSVFIAAQDSIFKYQIESGEQLAAAEFGSISTVSIEIYKAYLLVGNWYGSPDHNLHVYTKNDLSFVTSVAGITKGAKNMIIAGDSAFIAQNHTSGNWTDSAGYLAVVNLENFEHMRNIYFSNDDEDLGSLHLYNDEITALNPYSNSITRYNLNSGVAETTPFQFDIQVTDYGSQTTCLDHILYFPFNNGLGSYNLDNHEIINEQIIDTLITAFTMDTVSGNFWVTQTDYSSFKRGLIFSSNGSFIAEFDVGYSPEALAVYYDQTDFQMEDIAFWAGQGEKQAALVVDWNDGLVPESLAWGYRWNGIADAEEMMEAIYQADGLLGINMSSGFLNDIVYDLYQNGSNAHMGIGGEPDYWSTWSKTSASAVWEMNSGIDTSIESGDWFGCSYGFEPEATPPDNPEAAPQTNLQIHENEMAVSIQNTYDKIIVHSPLYPVRRWSIVDLAGKTSLKKDSLQRQRLTIGIDNLSNGVYLLRIETAAGNTSKKFYKF